MFLPSNRIARKFLKKKSHQPTELKKEEHNKKPLLMENIVSFFDENKMKETQQTLTLLAKL